MFQLAVGSQSSRDRPRRRGDCKSGLVPSVFWVAVVTIGRVVLSCLRDVLGDISVPLALLFDFTPLQSF